MSGNKQRKQNQMPPGQSDGRDGPVTTDEVPVQESVSIDEFWDVEGFDFGSDAKPGNDMSFQTYHVGGGGNCVYFSTAKQLSQSIHGNIRDELNRLYYDAGPEMKQRMKDTAQEMIYNQFAGGGIRNLAVNPELRDYDFGGKDAGEKIMDKLIKTEGRDLNDALNLRLLMEVKNPGKGYMGSPDSIYTSMAASYPDDLLTALNEVTPPGTKLPSVMAVAAQGDGYIAKVCSLDEAGKIRSKGEMFSGPPKGSDLNRMLNENGTDGKNLLGLRGDGDHCKAYVGSGVQASGSLNAVKTESRQTFWQTVKNLPSTIWSGFKSIFTKTSKVELPESRLDAMKAEARQKEKEAKENIGSKGKENSNDMSSKREMDSDGFDMLDDDFGDDAKEQKDQPKPKMEGDFELLDDFNDLDKPAKENPSAAFASENKGDSSLHAKEAEKEPTLQ